MKVGDKIYCKVNFDVIEKGDCVTIKSFTILNNIALYCEKKDMAFVMSNEPTIWYIWNYFYTNQEVRKLKLEKLNEGR